VISCRESELAELRSGLSDASAGHSHLSLLSGEPGIGKTRPADEFGRLAVDPGVRLDWGQCWEGPLYAGLLAVDVVTVWPTPTPNSAAILGWSS